MVNDQFDQVGQLGHVGQQVELAALVAFGGVVAAKPAAPMHQLGGLTTFGGVLREPK
jgi:hypothetical protein